MTTLLGVFSAAGATATVVLAVLYAREARRFAGERLKRGEAELKWSRLMGEYDACNDIRVRQQAELVRLNRVVTQLSKWMVKHADGDQLAELMSHRVPKPGDAKGPDSD